MCQTVIPFMSVCVCVCLKINVPLRPSSRQSSKLPTNGAGETSAGARDNQSMSMNLSGCHDMSLSNMTDGWVQTVMFSSPRALEIPSFKRQVYSLWWVARGFRLTYWIFPHNFLSLMQFKINSVIYSFTHSKKKKWKLTRLDQSSDQSSESRNAKV